MTNMNFGFPKPKSAQTVKEAREASVYLAAVADLVLDGEAQSRVQNISYLIDRMADDLEKLAATSEATQ